MTIVYVMNAPKIGGGNRVLVNIIEGLDRRRFRPVVVTPAAGGALDWARANGIACEVIPDGDWGGSRGLAARAFRLARLFRRHRARIVHTAAHTCYRAVGLAGVMTGTVRVCHLGFPPTPDETAWAFRWAPEAVVGCYRAQAEEVRAAVHAIRPDCRVVGIANSVEMGAPAASADVLPWRFGGTHVAAIVGHLSEVKGYPTFLMAAAKLRQTFDGCVFLAVGEEMVAGGYRDELERMAARLGVSDCVHFLGWQRDVRAIVTAADVMALPSENEGLPLAVLEAMSCERPVVATPVGGVPEAVINGVTGLLVPPSDPEALAAAIARLWRDRPFAETIARAGRRLVESGFSRATFIKRVEDLYDELLEARTGQRNIA
jgi:glycosyltransferase involved in cell wall biosynthesis